MGPLGRRLSPGLAGPLGCPWLLLLCPYQLWASCDVPGAMQMHHQHSPTSMSLGVQLLSFLFMECQQPVTSGHPRASNPVLD